MLATCLNQAPCPTNVENRHPEECCLESIPPLWSLYFDGWYWWVLATRRSLRAGSHRMTFPLVVSISACRRGRTLTMAYPSKADLTSSEKVLGSLPMKNPYDPPLPSTRGWLLTPITGVFSSTE